MKPSIPVRSKPSARRRAWKVLKLLTLILLIVAAVLVFGVFPYWLSSVVTNASTRSMDRKLTDTPATYGAEFKDVKFQTEDGVPISGWYLPSRGKRAIIVYSHGLFRSRRELLERAVDLWKLGYGALLYDARNHGESGEASVSLGFHEKLDAQAAVRYLREAERLNDAVVLYGISAGAVAALRAADLPEVAAVISDSAFLSLEETTDRHVKAFLKLPAFPLANELRFFITRRAHFEGSELNALEAVKRLGERPALFIAGADDRRMPPDIARQLYDASASPGRDLLIVEGPETHTHGHSYQAARKLYVERIDRFLHAALGDRSGLQLN